MTTGYMEHKITVDSVVILSRELSLADSNKGIRDGLLGFHQGVYEEAGLLLPPLKNVEDRDTLETILIETEILKDGDRKYYNEIPMGPMKRFILNSALWGMRAPVQNDTVNKIKEIFGDV